MDFPDLCEYHDSNKVGAYATAAVGAPAGNRARYEVGLSFMRQRARHFVLASLGSFVGFVERGLAFFFALLERILCAFQRVERLRNDFFNRLSAFGHGIRF